MPFLDHFPVLDAFVTEMGELFEDGIPTYERAVNTLIVFVIEYLPWLDELVGFLTGDVDDIFTGLCNLGSAYLDLVGAYFTRWA